MKSKDWATLQPLDFEFASSDILQHNGLAELLFPYLTGKAHAMMGGSTLVPDDLHAKVVLEAALYSSQLDSMVVVEIMESGQSLICTCLV